MRAARHTTLGVTALAALTLLLPLSVLAATVQDLVDLAQVTYKLACTANADQVSCRNRLGDWTARITPGGPPTAQETSLQTVAQSGASPLEAATQAWMTDMHQTACGDPKGVQSFVAQVGSLKQGGSAGPTVIGNCKFTGGLSAPGATAPFYNVLSVYIPPPPPPTPAPTPGATGTPGPTSTPKPTALPTPTPHASAGATAGPTPSPIIAPSESPSATPSAGASSGPSPSPSTSPVAGGAPTDPPTPGPTTPVAGPAEPTALPTPAASEPTFEQSVAGIMDVNTEAGAIGGSLLLALLMLLIIGFAGELFNNTVENNYSIIAGWLRKGPLGWIRHAGGSFLGEARIGLISFLLLTTLVSCFVDPNFGLDLRSLGEFLGFLVGLVIVLATFKLPPMLAHRRKTGDLGRLRPLPWALVIAGIFVLVSRIANLQPGYLYGIVLGAIFIKEVTPAEEGRETFYGSLWTLGAAALGWLALTYLHGLGVDPGGFAITLLATACAAVTVAGLEATAFGLMPMRFMPGYAVYRWNRLAWALLWGLSLFGFLHILIAPTSGYVSQLSPGAFAAALGVFAAFGGISILTWGYFRFRRPAAPLEVRFD
jgi:hypothetical protein